MFMCTELQLVLNFRHEIQSYGRSTSPEPIMLSLPDNLLCPFEVLQQPSAARPYAPLVFTGTLSDGDMKSTQNTNSLHAFGKA